MKRDVLLKILLLVSFLFVYLEWGKGQSSFLFQIEWLILSGSKSKASAFIHPFVLIPLGGQIFVLLSLFIKYKATFLTKVGIGLMSVLVLFILLTGCLVFNMRVIVSTLPFILISILLLIRIHTSATNKSNG